MNKKEKPKLTEEELKRAYRGKYDQGGAYDSEYIN